jgi:hypothetical protein
MTCSRACAALAAAIVAALPAAALAQFPPPPPPPGAPPAASVQDRWPEPPKPPQAQRTPAPAPAAPAAPKRAPVAAAGGEEKSRAPAPKAAPRAPAYAVTCGGVFARDSTHLKLAIKYDSRNVVFGQVDGPDGTKIPGTILFPNDPRRRLEVLWSNEAGRTDPSVIAINGKSQWTAPKGLKLGLPLATLEKMNGRPFKLSGFGADGTASVAGWEGGGLSLLPGGCKVGMRLAADSKAPPEARNARAADKEFLSNDASMRAVKPVVMEILIGY